MRWVLTSRVGVLSPTSSLGFGSVFSRRERDLRRAFYQMDDMAFEPKSHARQIPLWIGGKGAVARRRTAQFGDAWFPYHVEITVNDLSADHADLRTRTKETGRNRKS